MRIISRAEKVAEGKRLHAQDMLRHRDGGGQVAPGYSSYGTGPMFGPFLGSIQVPPLAGPGGYTTPANQGTSPVAISMAMQPHARGGGLGSFRGSRYAPYTAPHQKGFADGGFADRIEAANQPSANVEDAGAASAQDILFGAIKAFGVDPLRMSRFADQPPATTPMALRRMAR
jgi:hypothetical protein